MVLQTFPMGMEFYKTIYELMEKFVSNNSANNEHVTDNNKKYERSNK